MTKQGRRFGVLVFLAVALAGCGEPWNCGSGTCRFEHPATGCTTRDAYEQLRDEFRYIDKTKDTSRIGRLYQDGLCRRFSSGTVVEVLESGNFTVKVRFVHSPNEPDRWMSAEMLRPRDGSKSSSGQDRNWGWGLFALAIALFLGTVAAMAMRGKAPPSKPPSVVKQTAPVDPDWERKEEERRRSELFALKNDIIERSRKHKG